MANSAKGSVTSLTELTTTFDGGTAGSASETNNLGPGRISLGPGETAGRQLTEVWSKTYTNLASPVTIDLTALVGIGSRTVTLPALRYLHAVNADPTAGHDVQVGPGASNGLAVPWNGTSPYSIVYGGMPGAGIVANKAVGNFETKTNFTATGWAIDSTHKTILLTPVGTVTSFTITVAG